MLVSFSPPHLSRKPFRFFNYWAQKEGFIDTIRDHWRIDIEGCVSYQITQKLRLLKSRLKLLYGKEHIQMEVDQAKSELLHFQNLLHDNPGDQDLASQEKNATVLLRQLQQELNSALQQKAKKNSVHFGDDNNAFFYQSIKHRIRHNKIMFIHFKGKEISNLSQIHHAFFDFYLELFCFVDKDRTPINIDTVFQGPISSSVTRSQVHS